MFAVISMVDYHYLRYLSCRKKNYVNRSENMFSRFLEYFVEHISGSGRDLRTAREVTLPPTIFSNHDNCRIF